MEQILAQVRRVQRRLTRQLFVNRLLSCLFVSMLVALVAIAVPKLVAIENLPDRWTIYCLAAGLFSGLAIAAGWTFLRSRGELEAAIELDSRFGLRERVASSLSLPEEDIDSPAGRALTADALRAVRKLEVQEGFPLQLERRAWLPVVSALLAFLLVSFVENREAESSVDPAAAKQAKEQIDAATKKLRERLVERRKQAAEKGLKEAEGLFRELEEQSKKLSEKDKVDRKKALVKLNDLSKQLQERREKLGGEEQLRKQLEKMKDFNKGPADKMVDAMKKGDWKAAQQELQKLQEKLAKGEMDEADKKDLAKQLEQIQKKMAEAQAAQKKKMEDLKKQIEQQKQQGNMDQAGQLQQKLDQMRQQQQQMNKMQQLAQQAGACQECMKQGDQAGAAQAMQQMMQSMQQLQQEMSESEMLDAAMDQLQMAKDSMNCSECQGEGCQACNGMGMQAGMGKGKGGKNGMGMGEGQGRGPRPDEKNDVRFRDSRVRQNPRNGAMVMEGEADGPNLRGQVGEVIKQEMAASAVEPADPTVVEQLPKSRREHAEEFFNLLREGR